MKNSFPLVLLGPQKLCFSLQLKSECIYFLMYYSLLYLIEIHTKSNLIIGSKSFWCEWCRISNPSCLPAPLSAKGTVDISCEHFSRKLPPILYYIGVPAFTTLLTARFAKLYLLFSQC